MYIIQRNVSLFVCRIEALRTWRDKLGHEATYGKLLKIFVKANCAHYADILCEVVSKKCEASFTCRVA